MVRKAKRRSRDEILDAMRADKDLDLARHAPAATFGWDKDGARAALRGDLATVHELQTRLFAEGTRSLLVVLQAMDAGGKDGVLRNVLTGLNPAGVEVTSFGVPTDLELAHDYLWRVHDAGPSRGRIGVFNRSHYEDVLVVRVKHLVPASHWRKRYDHINRFERMLVDEGTAIVKLFLHISSDEQRSRLQDRLDSPDERWKFRLGDLDDRQLWPQYMDAYRDALARTSTAHAPWYVVPGDRKWVRNLAVAHVLRDAIEHLDPQYPEPEAGLDGIVVT
ncbi:polyphosphate kinase 2 family protein [soil metagenome]